MRKFIFLLCSVLVLSAAGPVYADKSVANASALLEMWTQEAVGMTDPEDPSQLSYAYSFPYPEYINGVWSTDGSTEHLTFSYLPGHYDEAAAELACVEDQSTVTLVEGGPYTIEELYSVQKDITRMGSGTGIYELGINVMENRLDCGIDMSAEDAAKTREELSDKYGDRVSFTEISSLPTVASEPVREEADGESDTAGTAGTADTAGTAGTADTAETAGTAVNRTPLILSLAAIAVILFAIIFFTLRRR